MLAIAMGQKGGENLNRCNLYFSFQRALHWAFGNNFNKFWGCTRRC